MQMYAISSDREVPEGSLSQYVLSCLREADVSNLKIVYSESDDFPVGEKISLELDECILLEQLGILERDEEFFTLGWNNTALLIPFEGKHFNLILRSPSKFPRDERFKISDATDVMFDYEDAYEGFGIKSVFPSSGRELRKLR